MARGELSKLFSPLLPGGSMGTYIFLKVRFLEVSFHFCEKSAICTLEIVQEE